MLTLSPFIMKWCFLMTKLLYRSLIAHMRLMFSCVTYVCI